MEVVPIYRRSARVVRAVGIRGLVAVVRFGFGVWWLGWGGLFMTVIRVGRIG